MATFTPYSSSTRSPEDLARLLAGSGSGLSLVPGSVTLTYGTGPQEDGEGITPSVSVYDGSIGALDIGAGLLLTSGDATPPSSNTSGSYSSTLEPSTRDADLTAAVTLGFPDAGEVEDATVLAFSFTVDNASLTGVQFDLVFASDEYPEFVDSDFVDIGAVLVNGRNYALFDGKADRPLSVLNQNLTAGGFRDNTGSVIPIEYDGISVKLTIVAPVVAGVNTIKIAVGDTGDPIYDSGLFVSNLRAVPYGNGGLSRTVQGTGGGDTWQAGTGSEFFDGGAGIDRVSYPGTRAGFTIARSGETYVITDILGTSGADTLLNVERVNLGNQWVALDLGNGQAANSTARLIGALFDTTYLNPAYTGIGISLFDAGFGKEQVAQLALDTDLYRQLAGSRSNADFVKLVYHNVVGVDPGPAEQAQFQGMLDRGELTQAQLAVLAADTDFNAGNIDLTGLASTGLDFTPA